MFIFHFHWPFTDAFVFFFKLAAKGVNFGQKILYILIAVASLLGTTLFFIQRIVTKKSVIGISFSEKTLLFTSVKFMWMMRFFFCAQNPTLHGVMQ